MFKAKLNWIKLWFVLLNSIVVCVVEFSLKM